jgi:WD40 repeat protein
MSAPPPFRIFVSSPSDVTEERRIAERVITRLAWRCRGRLEIVSYLHEHEPFSGHEGFQSQIPSTAEFDAVIVILWTRLGTRLGPQHRRPDGSEYESGTQKEFEEAVEARRRTGDGGRPDLGVYVKRQQPSIQLSDPKALERVEQYSRLTAFLERWVKDPETGSYHRAINFFEDVAHFEELLAKQLESAARRALPALVAASFPTAREVSLQGCPFRGLRSFELEHEATFFGRTRQTAEILDRLRRRATEGIPLVVLVGHSGAGKTSLAQAGVLPTVITPGIVEHVARWHHAVVPLSQRRDALTLLAEALWSAGLSGGAVALAASASELRERLRRDAAEAIGDHLDRLGSLMVAEGRTSLPRPVRLALVVDGLETLLHDCPSAERDAFAKALLAMARRGVWVIATMRIDYLHRCREVPALDEAIHGTGLYEVGAPSRSELAQIVIDRARAAGLGFEHDPDSGVRLDELILKDAEEVADNLCLLEFTLESLYERRAVDPFMEDAPNGMLRLGTYRSELRGLRGALAKRASEAQSGLSEAQRRELAPLFARLVDVGRNELPRRCACRRDDPLRSSDHSELIEALVASRIIVADVGEQGCSIVRLAHDSLLTDADAWPELHAWLVSTRDALVARDELGRDAARWWAKPSVDQLRVAGARFEQELALLEHPEVGPTVTEASRSFLDASQIAIDHAAAGARRLLRVRQGLTVLLAIAAAAALWAWRLADGRLDEARRQLYLSSLARGALSIADLRAGDAADALQLCPPKHRGWEWSFLTRLADQSAANASTGSATPRSVAIDGAGTRVLIGCEGGVALLLEWRHDGSAAAPPISTRLSGEILDVAFDHDGTPRILTRSDDGVHLHAFAERDSAEAVDCALRAPAIGRLAPDASRALLLDSAGPSASLEVVDLHEGRAPFTTWSVENLAGAAAAPRSSDDLGVTLHTLGGKVTRWEATDDEAIRSVRGFDSLARHESAASVAAYSRGGHLVTGSRSGGSLVCYDPAQAEVMPRMELPRRGVPAGAITAVAISEFAEDSAAIIVGTEQGGLVCVRLSRPLSGTMTSTGASAPLFEHSAQTLLGHVHPVKAVAVCARGARAVSVCEGGSVRLWELHRRGGSLEMDHGCAFVQALRFCGSTQIVLSEEGMEKLLDTRRLLDEPAGTTSAAEGHRRLIAISRCGGRLLEHSGDELIVRDAERTSPGATTARWHPGGDCIPGRSLAWSEDLATIAEAVPDEEGTRIALRRGSTAGAPASRSVLWPALTEPTRRLAVSENGQVIAATTDSNRLLVWTAASRESLASAPLLDSDRTLRLQRILEPLEHVQVFLDGEGARLVITGIVESAGTRRGKLLILRLADGEVLCEEEWTGASISAVAFSPSDELLATGDEDGAIRIWSLITGQELAILHGHQRAISGLAIHPDGDRIASAADGEHLHLWSLRWRTLLLRLPLEAAGARALTFDATGERLGCVVNDKLMILDGAAR